MKRLILILILFCIAFLSNAQHGIFGYYKDKYYVSESGNDGSTGKFPWLSWSTLDKVNNTSFTQGKQILFNKGGKWNDTLFITSSGIIGKPIIFDSYGNTGINPIIDYVRWDTLIYPNVEFRNITVGEFIYDEVIIPTYYVSNTGSDLEDGTTPETAWATIAKVNSSTFEPGDFIAFNKDGEWRGETLTINWSGVVGNPITFGAYGTGAKPVFNGAEEINNWTAVDTVGSEMVINGTFTTNTDGWTKTANTTISSVAGQFNIINDYTGFGSARQELTTVVGVKYYYSFQIVSAVNASPRVYLGTAAGGSQYLRSASSFTTFSGSFTATGTLLVFTMALETNTAGASAVFDNFSILPEGNARNLWRTPAPIKAVDPNSYRTVVVIDGNRFMPVATLADLDADLEYFAENPTGTVNDYIYVYSLTNPSLRTAELSTRTDGILDGLTNSLNSNIIIKDLEFRYYGYAGISLRGVQNETVGTFHDGNYLIDNCTFYHNRDQGVLMRDGYSNNIVQNCTAAYNGNGLYTSRGSHNNIFKNNHITNSISFPLAIGFTDGHGIGVYSSDNVLVEGNYLEEPASGGGGCIQLDQADGIFRYNTCVSKTSSGIGSHEVNAGDTLSIYSNLLIAEGSSQAIGLYRANGKINVYNNTTVKTGSGLHSVRLYYSNNMTLKNNIFYNSGATSSIVNVVYPNDGTPEMNYNLFFNKNNIAYYIVGYDGGRTLSAWQTAKGQDLNSAVSDPLFTSEFTNLQLQTGSPAINAGVDVGLTTDILGNPIVGNPDIGAYESPVIE